MLAKTDTCSCAATIRRLREERDEAREEVRQLRHRARARGDVVGTIMLAFGTSRTVSEMIAALYRAKGRRLTQAALLDTLYADRPEASVPELKIIQVYVHKVRKAFRDKGLPDPLTTYWGAGYALTPEARALIAEALA